jgi:hypothetical protein
MGVIVARTYTKKTLPKLFRITLQLWIVAGLTPIAIPKGVSARTSLMHTNAIKPIIELQSFTSHSMGG